MTTAALLHVYRCSFCKAIATSTVKVASVLRCRACLRLMAYQWSQRVETDADRALAQQGVVFNPWTEERTTPPKRRCTHPRCREYRFTTEMVYRGRFGYCSEACADRDAIEEARTRARVEAFYQERPWMRPRAEKESA